MTNLTAFTWTSQSPDITCTPAYEMERNGADMRYRIKLTISTVTGQSYFGYPIYAKIYLNGSLKTTQTLKAASPSQWSSAITYTSGWYTVSNKTTGTTSLSINLYSGSGSSRNGTYKYSLPIEPAASVLGSISNFTIGNSITIPITKYSSSFTDSLVIKIGSTTIKTINSITNNTAVTLTASEITACYKALPAVTKGTFTFILTTKSGSTTVGTSRRTATGTIPSSVVPTISSCALAETVSGLATQFGAYVQNKSKVKGTISASAGSGSSISNYKTVINGTTYNYSTNTFTTGILKTAGSNSFTVTVTDKRGRSASKTFNYTVVAYTAPKATTLTVARATYDGTNYTANDDGTYAIIKVAGSIASVGSKNTKSFNLKYRLAGSTASYTNVATVTNTYALNNTYYVSGMNVDNEYEFVLTATDYFDNAVKNAVLSTSFTLMNYNASGNAIAFGRVSDEENTLDIALNKTYLSKTIHAGGEKRLPDEKNFYFNNPESSEYVHNSKVYGGNATSPVAIGMWDTTKGLPIYQYFDGDDYRLKFGEGMTLRHGEWDIEAVKEKVIGVGAGRIHYSNGFLIQWGALSVTPEANKPTLATITFPVAYDKSPSLKLSIYSIVPGTTVLGYSHGAVRENNADIYITRTNTGSTAVRWITFGFKEVA